MRYGQFQAAPLYLKKEDLIKASKNVNKNKILLSITKFDAPVEWAFSLKSKGNLKPLFPKKLFENSQKFSKKNTMMLVHLQFFLFLS